MVKIKAVYQLKFPNGKVYIGSTKDLLMRLRVHKNTLKRGQILWYKDACKYSWNDVAISYMQVPEDDLYCYECMCIKMSDPEMLYNKLCVDNKSVTKDYKSVTN